MEWKYLFKIPVVSTGFKHVWSRNFLYFRKTWLVSFFWILLEPMMYLGAIGFGLGSFVNNMGGKSFVEFFFPGLLCSTAMMVSFFEGTYGNYTKLTHQKTYSTIMLTQVGPEEIVFGELLWVATKGFISVCGVVLIASVLGLVDTFRIFPALVILFFVCWMFACLAMIMTSYARNYDSFIYSTSGFIVPMSLIAGTYFPVESMSAGLKYLAYVMPLTHAVQAVRQVLADGFSLSVALHFLVVLALGYVAMNFAISRIRAKLLH